MIKKGRIYISSFFIIVFIILLFIYIQRSINRIKKQETGNKKNKARKKCVFCVTLNKIVNHELDYSHHRRAV